MGEAKRRKLLDPNFGKNPIKEVIKGLGLEWKEEPSKDFTHQIFEVPYIENSSPGYKNQIGKWKVIKFLKTLMEEDYWLCERVSDKRQDWFVHWQIIMYQEKNKN